MGSIKPVFIKRVGNKLIEEAREKFSTDFAHNKKVVTEEVECGKGIRNRIAGYIARQMRPKSDKKYRPKPDAGRRGRRPVNRRR